LFGAHWDIFSSQKKNGEFAGDISTRSGFNSHLSLSYNDFFIEWKNKKQKNKHALQIVVADGDWCWRWIVFFPRRTFQ